MTTIMDAAAEDNDNEFDSKEFDYPLDGSNKSSGARRSALKKTGQTRSAQNSSMLLKVSFQDVHLREYGMVLGDNPAVSHGAPVQLDWEPQEIHDPVHIDNYDKARSLWRAKDRRGFLLNAHKRVKILFAAGYTIDEIAKATMEMKEYRQLRADSLKTQGMMTGAIMALLSGAAETTGQTVKAVTILPNAIAGAGKAMVSGTSNALANAGTGMATLTDKVVFGTTRAVTGAATQGIQGTGKVMAGTANLMVKGTTGVVQGTGKVLAGTSKVGIDVVKGTGKVGIDVVKGTGKVGMDVVKGTGKVGMDVVKGTSNVMVGSAKTVVKGTGVLFSGTATAMMTSTKRLSRMVSTGMDSSSHSGSHHDGMDSSDRSSIRGSIFEGFKKNKGGANARSSFPAKAASGLGIPKPGPGRLTRQRSLDAALAESKEKGTTAELNEELLEMQDFLTQLEGMDKKTVQGIVAEEQEKQYKKNRGASLFPSIASPMSSLMGGSQHGSDGGGGTRKSMFGLGGGLGGGSEHGSNGGTRASMFNMPRPSPLGGMSRATSEGVSSGKSKGGLSMFPFSNTRTISESPLDESTASH